MTTNRYAQLRKLSAGAREFGLGLIIGENKKDSDDGNLIAFAKHAVTATIGGAIAVGLATGAAAGVAPVALAALSLIAIANVGHGVKNGVQRVNNHFKRVSRAQKTLKV